LKKSSALPPKVAEQQVATFAYRAVSASGSATSGEIEAGSRAQAVTAVRRLGLSPLDLTELTAPKTIKHARANNKTRAAVTKTISELSVLLSAGLQLDRALALAIENIEIPLVRGEFYEILSSVKEGMPLSRAMATNTALFSPMAVAMTEAGEADGDLGGALGRAAEALGQADDLRSLISTSLIYPVILLVIAVAVILLMLLFVVPQFESLFAGAGDKLPAASRFVMGASQTLRENGWVMLGVTLLLISGLRQWIRRPSMKLAVDRIILRMPQLGMLVRYIDTARFSRTLSVLVTGGVPLPVALAMAQRAIGNREIGDAVAKVASGVKEGEGLTAPLAAANVLPKLALGFLRTGEETSQLGPMLGRLADVLDRDVKIRLQRLIGLLTPAITVILGVTVAAIIASIMTAILGFNDLAVAS
jgi:general secretion pathway protein F